MSTFIAIQVMVETGDWYDALPVLHEINRPDEDLAIMRAIALQFNRPVRVTYPKYERLVECTNEEEFVDYISRLSGHYPNLPMEQKFCFPPKNKNNEEF